MDLNPFDNIMDTLRDLVWSGSFENYVSDKTSGLDSAMEAYKIVKDVANYGTTGADIVFTGGVVKPALKLLAAQNMIASKEKKSKAIKKAKKELAIAAGSAAAGLGVGAGVGKAVEKGIEAIALRRALKELDSVLGIHHSWTPGIKKVKPSTVPRGQVATTAGDQTPGYTYFWMGDFPATGVDKTSGLPWQEVRRRYYDDPNQAYLRDRLMEREITPTMTPEGNYPTVYPWQQNVFGEVPFQYKNQIDRWMDDPRYARGVSYIVKAPGKKVELDENLMTQPFFGRRINLFELGRVASGGKVKGPVKVIDEIPTGEINNIEYPYGVDIQELYDRYVQAIINQRQVPLNIIEKAQRIGKAQVPVTARSTAALVQLARLQAQNER